MNKQQPEALRLANALLGNGLMPLHQSASELRRQHAEIKALQSENETLRKALADLGKSLL